MVKAQGPDPAWTLARLLGRSVDAAALWREHGHHGACFRGGPVAEVLAPAEVEALIAAAPDEHLESLRGVSQPFRPGDDSVRVLRVQSLHPGVRALALGLLAELGEEINVNLYLSPPGAAGLGLHADLYDVLVCQLAGEKDWELAGSGEHRDEPFGPSEGVADAAGCVGRFTLHPGDVLFLPTGLRHRAYNAGSEPSIHLTVGIFTKSDRSVVEWIGHALTRAPRERWLPQCTREGYGREVANAGEAIAALLAAPEAAEHFVAHRQQVEYERTIATVAEHRLLEARGFR